jgi:TolB protein
MLASVLAVALAAPATPSGDDRLGPIVVDAAPVERPTAGRLPVVAIGVAGPHASATAPWFRMLRRDLELYGGFDVRDVAVDEHGAWLRGAAAGVVILGLPDDDGPRLIARVHDGEGVRHFEQALADAPKTAMHAHALTDDVLEALTGLRGGFASQLTFARTDGNEQRAIVLDADGADAKIVSRPGELVVSPTFDTDGRLVYAASVEHGRYRIRVANDPHAGADLGGSVYGIAFSPDGRRAAVTVARKGGIHLLLGTHRLHDLGRFGDFDLVLHPAFGSDDRLAFVAEVAGRPRVFVGDRAVSSRRTSAAAPAFCNHPGRPRLLWAEHSRDRWVLVRADASGRGATRISSGWGDARWPACSPDGRMVAFFSTGRGREPGLYVTHVDHFAPRRIAAMMGNALHWSGWQ